MTQRVGPAELLAQGLAIRKHEIAGIVRVLRLLLGVQMVEVAKALSLNSKILIMDEPTTALDVTVQEQILDLILDLADESGMGLIMISHDLGVIAQTTDSVAVMYTGI